MTYKNLSLFIFIFICSNAIANNRCATKKTIAYNYENSEVYRFSSNNSNVFNSIIDIPITAHIIRDSQGNGGLSQTDLDLAIADLNLAFSNANMNFIEDDVLYIDNQGYFDELSHSNVFGSNEYLMATQQVNSTINIFFVPNATFNGTNVGGWASYPEDYDLYGKDWIVIDNQFANNGSTIAHEIGHYFSLLHTHENGNELVDGSNCGSMNVGDELCDQYYVLCTFCVSKYFFSRSNNSYAELLSYGQTINEYFVSL